MVFNCRRRVCSGWSVNGVVGLPRASEIFCEAVSFILRDIPRGARVGRKGSGPYFGHRVTGIPATRPGLKRA